jgi:hypothetical protein
LEELKCAQEESVDFSCVCFKDYWFDQDSALPDTTFSDGKDELIIIRRGYNQGWSALALRQFGQLVRYKTQSNTRFGAV